MLRRIGLIAIMILPLTLISACATNIREEQNRPARSVPDTDRLVRSGIRIGDLLPDVTVYNADGNPFKLSQLKGHYAVIVFGCLT